MEEIGRAIAVTLEMSERLKPDQNDGPEAAFEEFCDARSLLKVVLLYTGDVSSSFSKSGSLGCVELLRRLISPNCMLTVREGQADRFIAGCILSMFLSRRDMLTFDLNRRWTIAVSSLVVASADSNEQLKRNR